MATKALVVGGTSGVGFGMACRIAASSPSAFVIISGRTKPELPHANMEFRPIEATSMREIKRFTDSLKAQQSQTGNSQFDLLIMTQGTMTMAGRVETDEGIDRKMALHYYGKQLLIRELLPALKEDAKAVIVFDSLTGKPEQVEWDDLDLKNHYSLGAAANHCQVMNDAMVQYFAAQQQEQRSGKRQYVHAWPGGVNTGLLRELPWLIRGPAKMLAPLALVTPDKCAERLLRGVERVSTGADQEGHQFWSCIDNKGNVIEQKKVFTEEKLSKVADHTWQLVDAALSA